MEQTRIAHFAALAPKKAASCCPANEFANGINFRDGIQTVGCPFLTTNHCPPFTMPFLLKWSIE